MKTLTIGIGIVLILIAVLLILAATQLKTVAHTGIERSLGIAFLTDVTVEDVDIGLREGHIEMRNLVVGNPASFRTGSAMELETVVVDIELRTIFSRTPTIRQITVKGANVNLRHELTDGTNLTMLARHASRFSRDAENGETESRPGLPEGLGREFIIKELACEEVTVAMSSNLIPKSGLKVNVAPFTLTEISQDHPVSTAEVSALFIRSLIKQTLSTKGLLRPIADLLRGEGEKEESDVSLIEEPEPELAD
ncbi:MAG: hypothetical protein R6V12_20050 [Candidatus Hydrogenedentota bacterium]